MTPLGIDVQHLSHHYPNPADPKAQHNVLQDISFSVAPGSLLCLLGPSGCGKTTLLRLIAGLERLQQGRIIVHGQCLSDAAGQHVSAHKRRIGFMFQEYGLFPHLSVQQNIEYGIHRRNHKRRQWVQQALQAASLSAYAQHYPHQLSGGQQQRVALLRALAPEPGVMLLDEPFSSLDEQLRHRIRKQTLELLKQTQIPTIMVTHDPMEALLVADQMAILDQGRIVQQDAPSRLYQAPATAQIASLFGPLNHWSLPVQQQGQQLYINMPWGALDLSALPDRPTTAQVQVGVRAEHVQLNSASALPRPQAEVLHSRTLGALTQVHLNIIAQGSAFDNSPLLASLPSTAVPSLGSRVHWQVAPEHIHLWPMP